MEVFLSSVEINLPSRVQPDPAHQPMSLPESHPAIPVLA